MSYEIEMQANVFLKYYNWHLRKNIRYLGSDSTELITKFPKPPTLTSKTKSCLFFFFFDKIPFKENIENDRMISNSFDYTKRTKPPLT